MSQRMSAFDVHFTMFLIEKGIIPFYDTRQEMEEAFAKLSPAARRKAKRKFRKLWRTAARKKEKAVADRVKKVKHLTMHIDNSFARNRRPTSSEKRIRTMRVKNYIHSEARKRLEEAVKDSQDKDEEK